MDAMRHLALLMLVLMGMCFLVGAGPSERKHNADGCDHPQFDQEELLLPMEQIRKIVFWPGPNYFGEPNGMVVVSDPDSVAVVLDLVHFSRMSGSSWCPPPSGFLTFWSDDDLYRFQVDSHRMAFHGSDTSPVPVYAMPPILWSTLEGIRESLSKGKVE